MTTNSGLRSLSEASARQMGLAEELVDAERFAEAISIYDQIVDREPVSYVLAKRGFAKFESNDFRGAIEDFDRAIVLKPDSPVTLRYRARSKESLGDLDGAVCDYRASLAFGPRSETHCDIAMIFEYQGMNSEAIDEFKLALHVDPDNEIAKNSLCQLGRIRIKGVGGDGGS